LTSASLHHHSVYGLTISSTRPIPGLLEVGEPGSSAWQLRFDRVPRPLPPAPSPESGATVRHDARGATMLFADATCVAIDPGRRAITVEEPEGATPEDTATYVSGPVAGLLARMSGLFCLHAAVVVVDGEAVALCGDSEWGKSTTAAAFAREGFSLLSDDVCAVDMSGSRLLALPGSPRIRLWPHGAEMVHGADHGLPAITPTWEKLYVDLVEAGRYEREPRPLGAVWLFAPGSERVEALSGARCLTALIPSVYSPQHATPEMRRRDLETAARICESVPVRLLPAVLSPTERVQTVLRHGE
jgi:hypothetical protein